MTTSPDIHLPTSHLAAVLERFNTPYTLKQVPTPTAATGPDLLIRVLAASYCHTDAVFASGALSQKLPQVGCHEFAGEIVAIGPDVPSNLGLAIGLRVGVPGRAYHPCGKCHECSNTGADPPGYSTYCPKAGNLGLNIDGGFQEYCLVDARQAAPLPSTLPSPQAAAMMCAGVTVWAALHHPRVRHRKSIAIMGAGGGLGHLGVQFAVRLGFHVVAVDANDKALALLAEVRSWLGDAGKGLRIADARKDSPDAIKAMLAEADPATDPSEVGVEAVIMLPDSQAAFDTGMQILRNRGTMVVVSFPKEKLQVNTHDLVFRDIDIVGSLVGRNHQVREMLDFVSAHNVKAKVETHPLSEIGQLVERSHQGVSGKLVVDMTKN
ncbi:chaperonin 10-like protein [Plectosphaerella plurivora]|uniref:Chaperonin 10-like protein n=1 Tax=Plectosphaerella plurivora TaxID=936078 RepID=A0A9P8V5P1_9PEZI|nr:chaperonin 10-like protein [Plectosphaerella plurivora]